MWDHRCVIQRCARQQILECMGRAFSAVFEKHRGFVERCDTATVEEFAVEIGRLLRG